MDLNDDAVEPRNCLIYWVDGKGVAGNGTQLLTRTLAMAVAQYLANSFPETRYEIREVEEIDGY